MKCTVVVHGSGKLFATQDGFAKLHRVGVRRTQLHYSYVTGFSNSFLHYPAGR